MRLGLSAEKENRVYSSGFDSLILALNQVILKVLLRAGLIATLDQPADKSGLGGEAAQRLGLCGLLHYPTCGIFHRRCFPHAKVEVRHTSGNFSVRWLAGAPVGRIQGEEVQRDLPSSDSVLSHRWLETIVEQSPFSRGGGAIQE